MNSTATENFTSEITPAFQFGLPYIFAPLMIISWIFGGWTILLVPIFGYVVITFFDALIGKKLIKPTENSAGSEDRYKYILYGWVPMQFFLIFGSLMAIFMSIFMFDHLSGTEAFFLMIVQGIISGAVGIVFAHELMHQKTRIERFLSDLEQNMFSSITGTLEHAKMRSLQDMVKTFINFLSVLFPNVFCLLGTQKRSYCRRKTCLFGISKILFLFTLGSCFSFYC